MSPPSDSTADRLASTASVVFGILSIATMVVGLGVPRKIVIGYGIGAWIAGVLFVKLPLYHLVIVRLLHPRLSTVWLGFANGMVSALGEMGAAVVFLLFLLPDLTLVQAIGFGVGAGAVEAIVLPFINPFKGTPMESHAGSVPQTATTRWFGLLERGLAMVTHVATRGLLWVGITGGGIVPLFVAFVSFGALDGAAYYGHLEKWPFHEPRIFRRVYLLFSAVALFQALMFAALAAEVR